MDEVDETFGRFQGSDRRIQLTKQLRFFVDDARRSGIVTALVIDGSYVTAKEQPGDIDLIVALRPDFNLQQELRPFEYNMRSRRMVRQLYKFDVFVDVDGSDEYTDHVRFFQRVKADDPEQETSQVRKGLLRVVL